MYKGRKEGRKKGTNKKNKIFFIKCVRKKKTTEKTKKETELYLLCVGEVGRGHPHNSILRHLNTLNVGALTEMI